MRSLRNVVLIISISFSLVSYAQIKPSSFNPRKGDRIILLGNTFADRMRHYGYFETLLQKNYPNKQLTLRNMGWSADEVGLQPRPLNFPGFRNSEAQVSEASKEVSFKNYKFEGVKIVMPVSLNFDGLYQDLTEQKADIIFLCFGMNESFKGKAGLSQFERDLVSFIEALRGKNFNGKSQAQLVLVSPIGHENLSGYMPDPKEHNDNLEMYTASMKQIALARAIPFIDLFAPSMTRMKNNPKSPLTINGIHLTAQGYAEAARWMANQLGFSRENVSLDFKTSNAKRLREVIKMKDDHFFYRWRAVNGEYIYGRRREPFGVLSFPPELKKLTRMAASLDSVIWQLGNGSGEDGYKKAISIIDERGKPASLSNLPDVVMKGRQGAQHSMTDHSAHQGKMWPATTESFILPEGYEINLFASEKDFPVEKPVAMNFDSKGRLWVATMPTYPQYFPGIPVHDRIVILEDTDHDGRADKHTVFADNLYLPLGFEFADGGVYVSQEPDIVFLKDTNGDDKADIREIVLTGFGSEDSHHATHAFTYGQDGALYFNEGTFLNSQVETPYGPIRSYAGATYRYEPRTQKLSHYISYPYYNPWGSVFDKWGTHLIGDASDGSNYFAPPMTGRVDYPIKHPRIDMFTTTRVRPTAGIEIVSSRQFPEEVQGDFLVNNNIGFQGTKQHQVIEKGSGITSKEVEPILQSSDPNFRPIDLKFGPDGALYVVDWYNPLVSHGENPPRDPMRDKLHGRIWRITYKSRPLLKPIDLSKQTLPELLENLKEPEDRLRYRTRVRLREMDSKKVIAEINKWLNTLDKSDSGYVHQQMEALWLFQDFNVANTTLLNTLLTSSDHHARAAATRVLRYWKDQVPDALGQMKQAVNDPSPRVRLEAAVALSTFEGKEAVLAACDIFSNPTDYYLDYAINETFNYFKPVWLAEFASNELFLSDNPKAAAYLLGKLSEGELLKLPQSNEVLTALTVNPSVQKIVKQDAFASLGQKLNKRPVEMILESIRSGNKANPAFADFRKAQKDLVEVLLARSQSELQESKTEILSFLENGISANLQAVGYASLIVMDGSDKAARKFLDRNPSTTVNYLRGISLLPDPALQSLFYPEIKSLATKTPVDSVNETAYRVMAQTIGGEEEKAKMICELITPGGANTDLAVEIISSAKEEDLRRFYAAPATEKILSFVSATSDDQQAAKQLNNLIVLGKKLAVLLPSGETERILNILNNAGTYEIKLSALPAKMLFDKELIEVTSGRTVSLLFENPDLMPHNVVIVKPGYLDKVGEAAEAMAKLKDGFEKNFVPQVPEVLFATPLVNTGKNFLLNFKAPEQPGDYPFICSFPGHWRVMKGILRVSQPGESKLGLSK